MKLVWLIGPHAVGKMTVGQELAKMTDLNLFHNHMSIELAVAVLGQRPNTWQLVRRIREAVFDEALDCPDLPGLIFTYMCAFDDPADVNYVREVSGQFQAQGAQVYYVELKAEKQVRLERNKSKNRLAHKPTKRDLEKSEALFLRLEEKYRLNTAEDEDVFPGMLVIDNTYLAPDETARRIKEHFFL